MKTKKSPSRICVGCREPKEKGDLIRIVKNAQNEISLDETGKKNGRGAYLCRNTECFRQAVKSRGLERSLKTAVPQEVITLLEKEMSEVEAR